MILQVERHFHRSEYVYYQPKQGTMYQGKSLKKYFCILNIFGFTLNRYITVYNLIIPGCFGGFVGDEILPSSLGIYFINHDIRIPINQPPKKNDRNPASPTKNLPEPGTNFLGAPYFLINHGWVIVVDSVDPPPSPSSLLPLASLPPPPPPPTDAFHHRRRPPPPHRHCRCSAATGVPRARNGSASDAKGGKTREDGHFRSETILSMKT